MKHRFLMMMMKPRYQRAKEATSLNPTSKVVPSMIAGDS